MVVQEATRDRAGQQARSKRPQEPVMPEPLMPEPAIPATERLIIEPAPLSKQPHVSEQPSISEQLTVSEPPLVVAPDLRLPLEAVTETFAILAKRGSGKTYTAAVLVEEMLKAGQTVVVTDPVGVWWGLRSSADGRGPGLPIVILGGEHADAPLAAEAGAVVADLAAEERLSLVLDLSRFTPPEQTRFMTLFAERLYQKNRRPLHLVLDEADQFVPQVPEAGQQPLLWAMNRIVRLGRARGLGVTLISQRPAVLAKNVLTQTEVLVTMRLTSPQDRKAVEAWVSAHDAPEQRQEMLASLASLPVGTAWLWSPGWLDLFVKVQVRRRDTFDSSATPKVGNTLGNNVGNTLGYNKIGTGEAGQVRTEPAVLAAVDLDRLRSRLEAVADAHTLGDLMPVGDARNAGARPAGAEEPGELRRQLQAARERIVILERPGAEAQPVVQRVEVPVRVEVPLLVPVLEAGQVQQLQEVATALLAKAETLHADAGQMASVAQAILDRVVRAAVSSETVVCPGTVVSPVAVIAQGPLPPDTRQTASSEALLREKMPLAERKILTALAQYPGGRSKRQVAVLTGYAIAGGGFNNAVGALRSKSWIEGKDILKITAEGEAALGQWEPLPRPGQALADYWASQLGKAERLIMRALVQAHPRTLTKEQLGSATGYAAAGGSFNNALGRLRTLELIQGRSDLRASDTLCGDVLGGNEQAA